MRPRSRNTRCPRARSDSPSARRFPSRSCGGSSRHGCGRCVVRSAEHLAPRPPSPRLRRASTAHLAPRTAHWYLLPMSIQSEAELEALREVGRITRQTLDALENRVRVGVSTAELDKVAADLFAKHGARSAPALVYGFPGSALISIND